MVSKKYLIEAIFDIDDDFLHSEENSDDIVSNVINSVDLMDFLKNPKIISSFNFCKKYFDTFNNLLIDDNIILHKSIKCVTSYKLDFNKIFSVSKTPQTFFEILDEELGKIKNPIIPYIAPNSGNILEILDEDDNVWECLINFPVYMFLAYSMFIIYNQDRIIWNDNINFYSSLNSEIFKSLRNFLYQNKKDIIDYYILKKLLFSNDEALFNMIGNIRILSSFENFLKDCNSIFDGDYLTQIFTDYDTSLKFVKILFDKSIHFDTDVVVFFDSLNDNEKRIFTKYFLANSIKNDLHLDNAFYDIAFNINVDTQINFKKSIQSIIDFLKQYFPLNYTKLFSFNLYNNMCKDKYKKGRLTGAIVTNNIFLYCADISKSNIKGIWEVLEKNKNYFRKNRVYISSSNDVYDSAINRISEEQFISLIKDIFEIPKNTYFDILNALQNESETKVYVYLLKYKNDTSLSASLFIKRAGQLDTSFSIKSNFINFIKCKLQKHN